MVQSILNAWPYVERAAMFAASVVTILVGLTVLIGYIRNRDKLRTVLSALASLYLNQQASRLKETLGKLEPLSYDRKQDRQEIVALLGQLRGQIQPVLQHYPDLEDVLEPIRNPI